jgi:proprotein convertase subtilisin/kexin type 5
LSCISTNKRELIGTKCPCITKYQELPNDPICYTCDTTCETCHGPATTDCDTCFVPQFRTFNLALKSCPCSTGYYDSGADICSLCYNRCETCKTTATNCLSCIPAQFRTRSGSVCNCSSHYFQQAAGDLACTACNSRCFECTSTSQTACLSCYPIQNRVTSGSTCVCDTGYFDSGTDNCFSIKSIRI